MEQLTLFDPPKHDNSSEKIKRRWEDAFQHWSNLCSAKGNTSRGSCGYGAMCDWCTDPNYGRPCVRALNAMCRDLGITIDYTSRNFDDVWGM